MHLSHDMCKGERTIETAIIEWKKNPHFYTRRRRRISAFQHNCEINELLLISLPSIFDANSPPSPEECCNRSSDTKLVKWSIFGYLYAIFTSLRFDDVKQNLRLRPSASSTEDIFSRFVSKLFYSTTYPKTIFSQRLPLRCCQKVCFKNNSIYLTNVNKLSE